MNHKCCSSKNWLHSAKKGKKSCLFSNFFTNVVACFEDWFRKLLKQNHVQTDFNNPINSTISTSFKLWQLISTKLPVEDASELLQKKVPGLPTNF